MAATTQPMDRVEQSFACLSKMSLSAAFASGGAVVVMAFFGFFAPQVYAAAIIASLGFALAISQCYHYKQRMQSTRLEQRISVLESRLAGDQEEKRAADG